MLRRIPSLLLVVFCGIYVTPVMAADSGWYAEVGIGQTSSNNSALYANAPALPAGWTTSNTSDNSGSYRLLVIHKFNRYWGIEGGYVKLGRTTMDSIYSATPIPIDTGTYETDQIDVTGLLISGIANYPFAHKWTAFGRLGLVDVTVDYSAHGNLPNSPGSDQTNTSWKTTYGIGVSRAISGNWNASLSWDRYSALGKSLAVGDYKVSLISLGVQYKF